MNPDPHRFVSPPILKTPEELKALGIPENIIELSRQQHTEWEQGPHCCGMRGFNPADGHRCAGCERDARNNPRIVYGEVVMKRGGVFGKE